MSSLTIISATSNDFNGSLPSNMLNTLSNLQQFYIGENQFSGTIPISIANASSLQELDLSGNNLVGQVPSLGKLHDIQRLNLEQNYLGLALSMESPKERMNIFDVIKELDIIKKAFLAGVRTRD
ncbi:non-specific serine/threonine protein kinase [Trifolium repens]|nr:non-specific serine/threonine protein kinase [Trifolium repens]